MAPQLLPAAMTAGPCCVFIRATAPPANDAPPDAVAGEGAAPDGVASDADFDEEQVVWLHAWPAGRLAGGDS